MKKILLLLAIVLMAGGAVWAQVWDFSAVGTESVEARYSAGRFGSDVDDYIDATWHDPEIGTFMFLGGWHGAFPGDYAVSLGFGRTLGAAYLGLYYGGRLAEGSGDKDTSGDVDLVNSTAQWNSDLAVLLGIAGMGFRLDLRLLQETEINDVGDYASSVANKFNDGRASIAFTWGANMGNLAPFVTLGFKFPSTRTYTDATTTTKADNEMTISGGSLFGLMAGGQFALDDTSAVSASLGFGYFFPTSYKGDTETFTTQKPWTQGGAFGLDFDISYKKSLAIGSYTTLAFAPNLNLGIVSVSNNSTREDVKDLKAGSDNDFSLSPGIKIGFEYKYNRIALYTGLNLTFCEWTTSWFTGDDNPTSKDYTEWGFSGIKWNSPAGDDPADHTSANLSFGITFELIENLVFGAGANVFTFNPRTMTVNNYTTGATGLILNSTTAAALQTQVTVSYKF